MQQVAIKSLFHMRGGKRVCVVLEDGRRITLTKGKAQALQLCESDVAPTALLTLLNEKLTPQAAKDAAARMGMRPIFTCELEQKLIKKGFSPTVTQDTIEWMQRIGALNDQDTLRCFLADGESKGKGQKALSQELIHRGFDREAAKAVFYDHEIEPSGAVRLLERRLKGSTEREALKKAVALLYRRGFDRDTVASVINQYIAKMNSEK